MAEADPKSEQVGDEDALWVLTQLQGGEEREGKGVWNLNEIGQEIIYFSHLTFGGEQSLCIFQGQL